MSQLGYVEGKSVLFHARFGDGTAQRLLELSESLVRERLDLIVTQGPAVMAMKKIGAELPIVFGFSGNPVAAGFARSLARPGGNMTGISFMSLDLAGKRMELLKEAVPRLKSVAILANPEHPGEQDERRVSAASAKALGLSQTYFQADSRANLDVALTNIAKGSFEALMVFPDALTLGRREQIAQEAIKARVAAISGWAQFADSGFLMSYGPNLRVSFSRLAVFVDKILKGAKPADLPVELPTVVEMVANLSTAKALGLEIPQSVLVRAERVIQ